MRPCTVVLVKGNTIISDTWGLSSLRGVYFNATGATIILWGVSAGSGISICLGAIACLDAGGRA